MGHETSKEEKQEKSILRRPEEGKANDFYRACQTGDLEFARKLIASNAYVDINRLEPNGSTALHAASHVGHPDIVRLLLHQYGVMRHRRNQHGLTAYEESANDEIRQLWSDYERKQYCNTSYKGFQRQHNFHYNRREYHA